MTYRKDLWGETIEKVAILFVLAMAVFAVPAMAHSAASAGTGGVDILGDGIFETGDSAFKFPYTANTNFDTINVGNDFAQAIGAFVWGSGLAANGGGVSATNDLEIKKNQDSGDCECCALDPSCPSEDCCTKYNVEQIKVGNRNAQAIGAGGSGFPFVSLNGGRVAASNTVKIVTNQQ